MAMKTCKECGESVSTRAKYYPHCGTDKPRTGRIARFIRDVVVYGGAVILAAYVATVLTPVLLALIRG